VKLEANPNDWSCLPTAFATAVGREAAWMIRQIGHDGSSTPYKDKEFRAGFHEQECIEVLQRFGYACTPIEAVPAISPTGSLDEYRLIYFGEDEMVSNIERFKRHLEGSCGVLTGVYIRGAKTVGHAVAWDGAEQQIYDPNLGGRVYPFEDASKFGFTPRCYWKVQYVKAHG